MMKVDEIKEYLPQRYPFLLVDRVVEIELGKRIVAYKNVTINEPFFNGHFPDNPIMPGVLIIEALAQAAGVLGVSHVSWSKRTPASPPVRSARRPLATSWLYQRPESNHTTYFAAGESCAREEMLRATSVRLPDTASSR